MLGSLKQKFKRLLKPCRRRVTSVSSQETKVKQSSRFPTVIPHHFPEKNDEPTLNGDDAADGDYESEIIDLYCAVSLGLSRGGRVDKRAIRVEQGQRVVMEREFVIASRKRWESLQTNKDEKWSETM
jgi:hypothetical protein